MQIYVQQKETGQVGTLDSSEYDPSQFSLIQKGQYDAAPSNAQTQQQQEQQKPQGGGIDLLGVLNALNPVKTTTSMIAPEIKSIGQSLGMIPELGQALIRGQSANVQQRQQFSQDWNKYIENQNTNKNEVTQKFNNPYNWLGVGGEVGSLAAASPIEGAVNNMMGKSAVSAVAPSLIQKIASYAVPKLAAGAFSGGLYGATRPEDQGNIGNRVTKGAESAAIGAPTYLATSAILDALKSIPGLLQKGADYSFYKNAPPAMSENLGAPEKAQALSKEIMDATTSNTPEGIASQLQDKVTGLMGQKADLIKNANVTVPGEDISQAIDYAKENTSNFDPSGGRDKAEFTKINDMVGKFFDTGTARQTANFQLTPDADIPQLLQDPEKKAIIESLMKANPGVPIDELYKYQQPVMVNRGGLQGMSVQKLQDAVSSLGDYLSNTKALGYNGKPGRLDMGTATPYDIYAKNLYDQLNTVLNNTVANVSGDGTPTVSEINSQISKNIKGGEPYVAQARQGTKSTSGFMAARGLVGINRIIPFVEAAATGLTRGVDSAATSANNAISNPIIQNILKALPAVVTQTKLSNTVTGPNQIKVYKNDTGETGYIPTNEYDPKVYTKL